MFIPANKKIGSCVQSGRCIMAWYLLWKSFLVPPASISNSPFIHFPRHRSFWGEKRMLQAGLWPVLWLGPAERPQNDEGRGGSHEAEDDRHLGEPFVADGSEHQWHHSVGRGCLLPRLLCLSPAFCFRLCLWRLESSLCLSLVPFSGVKGTPASCKLCPVDKCAYL